MLEIVALGKEAIDESIDLLLDSRRQVRLAGHWILVQLVGFDLGWDAEAWRSWWTANSARTRTAWLMTMGLNTRAPIKPRIQAVSQLGQRGASEQLPTLISIWQGAEDQPFPKLRDRALAAIGRIGGAPAVQALIRYGLKDSNVGNRARTILLLGRSSAPGVEAALRTQFSDQSKTAWGTTIAEEARKALERRRKRN